MKSLAVYCLSALLLMAGSGCGALPDPPVTTLWQKLGVPQSAVRLRDSLVNRRGNFPGLERKPPLLALADPANLESPVEAIKVAAEVKMAEDLKKQKIKALKYLGETGCGCYDKEGKIESALLAALEDCTPDVRIAAAEAIQTAVGECACVDTCAQTCCTEKIQEKLAELAYGEEDGCYIEPNPEVRAAALAALTACPPLVDPLDPDPVPEPEFVPEGEGTTSISPAAIHLGDADYYPEFEGNIQLQSAIETLVPEIHIEPEYDTTVEDEMLISAVIEEMNLRSGSMAVNFYEAYELPAGTHIVVIKGGQEVELVVEESSVGRASGSIVEETAIAAEHVAAGDSVNVGILVR